MSGKWIFCSAMVKLSCYVGIKRVFCYVWIKGSFLVLRKMKPNGVDCCHVK